MPIGKQQKGYALIDPNGLVNMVRETQSKLNQALKDMFGGVPKGYSVRKVSIVIWEEEKDSQTPN